MSLTKEIINQEKSRMQSGIACELHLWREGAFLRAYDWSAWLCCHFLHDFKVNHRQPVLPQQRAAGKISHGA